MLHFDPGSQPQFLTFRLDDSLPGHVLEKRRREVLDLPVDERSSGLRRRIEADLDAGFGDATLRDPRVAAIVRDSLRHFDGERYDLHAWTIMPTHVHAAATPRPGCDLGTVVGGWKSFTSHEINRLLGRKGRFWQRHYFDSLIESEREFGDVVRYIENNPVKAGLSESAADWLFGSAGERHRDS